MREILFRAKRIDNGEWVEGYYSKSPDPMLGFLKDFIFAPYFDEKTECGFDNGYKIDINTLCQYTGLTDKNGNKIWENDVLSIVLIGEEKENCIVRYGRKVENFKIELGFNVEWTKTNYLRCDICFWTECGGVEVIGNIFDNPELVKGE